MMGRKPTTRQKYSCVMNVKAQTPKWKREAIKLTCTSADISISCIFDPFHGQFIIRVTVDSTENKINE